MITQNKPEVHINGQAVLVWCQKKRFYGRVTITFEAGIPMKVLVPDGIGVREVLIKDILKAYFKK